MATFKRRKQFCAVLSLVGLLVIITLEVWQFRPSLRPAHEKHVMTAEYNRANATRQDYLDKEPKVLLLYSTMFGQTHWPWIVGKQTSEHFSSCGRYKNCLATYNMSWLGHAHAVVLHGRDVENNFQGKYSPSRLREEREKISSKVQMWVYLSHENPQQNPSLYQQYNGVFNWLATFDRNSDVYIPYSGYVSSEYTGLVTRDYAKEKSGLVAWAVSNCGLLREQYALELQKYLTLTVYGRCRGRFKNQRDCAHNSQACRKELSTYKFYLAFENNFCHDYVTEKYWERIQQDVVPIVMGANFDDGVAIPGSYIDASKFDSIQKFAEYLLYLDRNNEEYNKYFSYKNKYKTEGTSYYCAICEALHTKKTNATATIELGKSFNYESNCGVYRPVKEKYRKQVEISRNS